MNPGDEQRLRADVLEAERLERTGERAAAAEVLRRALAYAPGLAPLHSRLGMLLHDLGRFEEGATHFTEATRIKPQEARYWNNLAAALNALGRHGEAQTAAGEAIARNPNHAWAHFNRGRALASLGRSSEAQQAFTRTVEIDPAIAVAWESLGHLLIEEGRLVGAHRALERATALNPASAGAWARYGASCLHLARHAEAIAAMERAESLHPPDEAAMASARLVALHFDGARGREEIFEAHCDWARRFAPPPDRAPFANRRDENRRLRIGYVSQRFHGESLLRQMFEPVFARHDRDAVEIYCYSTRAVRDDVSRRIEALADHWVDAAAMGDEELARRIRADEIDIAVDLGGHTPEHRLAMFARRPAPVCATWLDYFDTTGLATMDHLVTDDVHSPPGDAQRFTEKLARLPRIRFCYAPVDAPEVVPPPLARGGAPILGSFNRLAKLSSATLDAWCRALRAVPDARLVIKNSSLGYPDEHEYARALFRDRGIDPARLDLRGFSHHRDMLAEYGGIDLVLDTFPYNGGMTTFEALWMGRPVVTIRGDSLISRQGAAILEAVGLGDFVADDAAGFAAIVERWAHAPGELAAIAASLRDRMRASPLMDPAGLARALERAYRAMWREWLRQGATFRCN